MQSASAEGAVDYLGLERWAVATPLATALAAFGQEPLTYSRLWNHIIAVSRALAEAGLRSGEVAVLAIAHGSAFVSAALAITRQYACAPFDLDLSQDECQLFLTRLNASALVYEEGIQSPIVGAARSLGLRLIRVRCSDDLPAGVFSLELIERARDEQPSRHTDAAFLFHTSATTDVPKLVPRTRANARAAAEQDARALGLSAADRFMSLMPLWYAHGISAVFSQLVCGGTVLCASPFQAHKFVASIEQFRPTWFSASPAIQRIILNLLKESPEVVQRIPLRFVRSAGAAPAPDVILMQEKLFGVPVLDGYGMTEAPSVTRNRVSHRQTGSVGKSTGTEISIMGESGELLPPETEGEIVLRGPTVMSGYVDNAEANLAAFHDGWFRTGDIGRLDHQGFLFILGRLKEMINRGGKKIFPHEVDIVLSAHPAVAEVACFAVPHRTLGEDIAAAVVLRPDTEASELELRRFAAARLAGHKVPRKIVFTRKIPRTPTGKPKRGELAAEFRARATPAVATGQLTSVERQVADIWRRILGVERIDVTDDFFDLGGDSLSTALMLAEVEKSATPVGRQLDLSNFFVEPTVQSLSKILRDCYSQAGSAHNTGDRILFLRKEGTRTPFFCFSDSETNQHQFHYLFRWLSPDQPFMVVGPIPIAPDGRRLRVEEIARQSVASIRAIHPRGPYLLGGYCFGGVVAFETARQLLEQGSEVTLLALFDSPTPGYPKVAREWKRYVDQSTGMLRALAKGKRLYSTGEIAAHLRVVVNIVSRQFGAPARRGLFTAGAQEISAGEAANSLSRREYVPRILTAPMVHFIGADVPVSDKVLSDPRFGWQDFAVGGFQALRVPGDHVSIFSHINAPALAAELDNALMAADAAFQERHAPSGIQ